MKYMIKDNQAGFVLKNGVFQKMITSGTYYFSKLFGYHVEIEEMTGEVDYLDVPYQVLSRDSTFLNATVHIEIPDGFSLYQWKIDVLCKPKRIYVLESI